MEVAVADANPATLNKNEFRVSDVPPGNAMPVGEAAVFNVGGCFYATEGKCTHRKGELSKGKLDGSTVTCPKHGAQFNVTTGDVLRGPAEVPLNTYRVRVEGDVGCVESAAVATTV